MKRQSKRLLSILIAMTLLMGVLSPAFSAATNITHLVDIYADGAPVTAQISLVEGDALQLTPTLIDCSMPQGGYFYWESDTPILASVDQEGLLRGRDSSKMAEIRLWIDNEIRTIPVTGGSFATSFETLFSNMDVDAMDNAAILAAVRNANILPANTVDAKVDNLGVRLSSLDTTITVFLYDADGNIRATDAIQVVVTKSAALTAEIGRAHV